MLLVKDQVVYHSISSFTAACCLHISEAVLKHNLVILCCFFAFQKLASMLLDNDNPGSPSSTLALVSDASLGFSHLRSSSKLNGETSPGAESTQVSKLPPKYVLIARTGI